MATGPQLQKLAIIRSRYADRGYTREDWFDWVERELGRRVESNRELTVQQASHMIEIAEALKARG